MSSSPFGPNENPFGGIFGDIAKMLGGSDASYNSDVAKHIAMLIATDGNPEKNPEPTDRMQLEQIVDITRRHVEDVTGVTLTYRSIDAITPSTWSTQALDDHATLLDRLANAIHPRTSPDSSDNGVGTKGSATQKRSHDTPQTDPHANPHTDTRAVNDQDQSEGSAEANELDENTTFEIPDSLEGLEDELNSTTGPKEPHSRDFHTPTEAGTSHPTARRDNETRPNETPGTDGPHGSGEAHAMEQQNAELQELLAPVILGMQIGGMIGHLSRTSFGLYDTPIPRGDVTTLQFVPTNIVESASAWELPKDELMMIVATEELARHAVFHRSHIRAYVTDLLNRYVGGFRPNFLSLIEKLSQGNLNPMTLSDEITVDDELMLGENTPEQATARVQLRTFLAVFVGYVDFVVDSVLLRMFSTAPASKALYRAKRTERSQADGLRESLLGIAPIGDIHDAGTAFVRGVLERTDANALLRLWESPECLPTPSELTAPGLWLARHDLG